LDTLTKDEIFILAGEVSGDLHASGLIREYHKLSPEVRFFGTGGDRMIAEGVEAVYHVKDIGFLGIVEVVKHLPFIRRMMRRLLDECRRRRPQAVVLVDYPGFNLRFAKELRAIPELARTPILYYISPQVWAWHASRIPQIARLVNRMAVIFDFEVPLYQAAGLHTEFVGHPMLEIVHPSSTAEAWRRALHLSMTTPLLAVMPGSRLQEVRSLFPLFLQTIVLLRQELPELKALVGCSPSIEEQVYREFLESTSLNGNDVILRRGDNYDILAHCDVALVASGTVTLETAILGTPLVMAYRLSHLTYLLGRHLVKIPDLALVNVVAGKRVVPEFVQSAAQPQALAAEIASLLKDSTRRRAMRLELAKVRDKLGQPGASRNVAAILHEMVHPPN
jgi:lipid-A-disaccharide synthase